MRILYVGELGAPWSTGRQRFAALRDLGHTLLGFDTHPFYTRNHALLRALSHRAGWGPPQCALNRDLLRYARGNPPEWVWIDKGIWLFPETIAALRERARLTLHFTPDPAFVTHLTWSFLHSVPQYDLCVTSKAYEIEAYRRAGARRLFVQAQGFDRDTFKPFALTDGERATLSSDVVFVGHSEPHYVECVRAAARETPSVAVWGPWGKVAERDSGIRPLFRGRGVYFQEYAKAVQCAKIALGLLSRLHPDRHTTRTFEIPASGGFMLAERTEEHQELFEEGKEAAFFDGTDELREKIRYYLKHDHERRSIAAAGRERCVRSGYSYHDRLEKLIAMIQSPSPDPRHEIWRLSSPPPALPVWSRLAGLRGWMDALAGRFGPQTTVPGAVNAVNE